MDKFTEAREILTEIQNYPIANLQDLEAYRIRFLGTKNILKDLFAEIKNVPNERKKEFGQLLNELKTSAEERFELFKNQLEEQNKQKEKTSLDLTMPGDGMTIGLRHPISIVKQQIIDIFSRIGYVVEEDREIEDDYHNFTALNIPENHPARDMQDTFFIQQNPDIVLRTHTSSVQIRVMERSKPPIRILSPGKVYRNETISARSHCYFHQVEGLYIDKNVSIGDLKQTLLYFAKEMFGEGTQIKMRPSYFPFTEPSAEVDISCFICSGKGCNICKHSGWVEILGCGMVDPQVLENCGIDSSVFSGFAFGLGVERITMLKYQINDIRLFSENDVRFLKQFSGAV